MSSITYVTVSMPILESFSLENCFNVNAENLIEIDKSHYNIFKKLKSDNISTYITSTSKGDMFGFSMAVNYLNKGTFLVALSKFIELCEKAHAVFKGSQALVLTSEEHSNKSDIFIVCSQYYIQADELNYGYFND